MEKEFIPYEQALALKELGFNEPCLSYYEGESFSYHLATTKDSDGYIIPAPLYQQAFRWFREKYGLHSYIDGAYSWFRFYINSNDNRWEGFKHLTYEEAELECLKKLIEIVK